MSLSRFLHLYLSFCLRLAGCLTLSIEPCKSSIYPFQGLKRPLQFLGLYNTTLCNVTHIPAFKVRLLTQSTAV